MHAGHEKGMTGSLDTADPRVQRVLATVDAVPRGRVATYGQIARAAGLAGRARWVGRVLRDVPAACDVPWHRVLGASGRISPRGDPASERRQRRRLEAEGVRFERDRVDLRRYGWDDA